MHSTAHCQIYSRKYSNFYLPLPVLIVHAVAFALPSHVRVLQDLAKDKGRDYLLLHMTRTCCDKEQPHNDVNSITDISQFVERGGCCGQ